MSGVSEEKVIICRCEEITLDEIRLWSDRGCETFGELNRVLRVGMGPCQGRGCQEIILRELSRRKGIPIAQVVSDTVRPPVKPIKTGLLASEGGVEAWSGKAGQTS